MKAFMPAAGRLARIGLALAALVSLASVAGPAAADDWNNHYHHHDNGFFALQFGAPGYYAPPPACYYVQPSPYYPPRLYCPAPAYYAPPAVNFGFVFPLGHHH